MIFPLAEIVPRPYLGLGLFARRGVGKHLPSLSNTGGKDETPKGGFHVLPKKSQITCRDIGRRVGAQRHPRPPLGARPADSTVDSKHYAGQARTHGHGSNGAELGHRRAGPSRQR